MSILAEARRSHGLIRTLSIKNLTLFSDAVFQFAPGLNVIIGENATGKSHLLKLAYTVACIQQETLGSGRFNHLPGRLLRPNKTWIQRRIAEKLLGVFKPDTLGRLCRRGRGRARTEVSAAFDRDGMLGFSFATNSTRDVTVLADSRYRPSAGPIFFPAKEVLSLYPGFAPFYEERELSIDETYYDLCKLLSRPLLRGPRFHEVAEIIGPLEEVMGGKVRLDAGRFYIDVPGQGKMEISLVAEGIRKVAMLAYLAANGALRAKSTLFWDEPESNLNPRIMTKLASTLNTLATHGVQVFVATHSLFMMKELSLLLERDRHKDYARFFGLVAQEGEVMVEEGALLEDLQTIVSLDEVLGQDDREQEPLIEESP